MASDSDPIADRIWRSVVAQPAAPLPDDYPTLAARTQGLYLVSGFDAPEDVTELERRGRRLQVWHPVFTRNDAVLSELQRFRLLQLAEDPGTETLARFRGSFGTGVASEYLAVLRRSEDSAYRVAGLGGISLEKVRETDAPACDREAALDDVERIMRDGLTLQLHRRQARGESYLVPLRSAVENYLGQALVTVRSALLDEGALPQSQVNLLVDYISLDAATMLVDLGVVCGHIIQAQMDIDETHAVPVALQPGEPLPDEIVELNRNLLPGSDF